ncbi:MAG: hypothetical protein K2I20_05305 [Clostridia bacterium]|nr:hypothetical protein [Clostridia bacterium]MDE7215101.1 hypothetical protein [Clostridia bacterium]
MKRKILIAAIAAIAACACVLGLTACGGGNDNAPKPSALENAYANYRQTQNLTVTVTDSRTVKHGTDYSALVKIDYAHKAAYSKNFYTTTDNLGDNHKIVYEKYYEIDSSKPAFTIYGIYCVLADDAAPSDWDVIDRSDLFDLPEATSNPQKFEIQLFTDFVNSYIPSHALIDTSWRESESSDDNYVSLDQPALLEKFTESANGYTADVYFCINNDGTYVPYACTVAIKLDAQERFKSVVIDFGANGKIKAEYVYGNTTVTVPEDAKSANHTN